MLSRRVGRRTNAAMPASLLDCVSPSSLASTRFASAMSELPGIDRRRFCATAAATLATRPLGLLDHTLRRYQTMTDVMAEVAPRARGESPDIRPFRVSFPDTDIAELRRRVKATRWPDRETVSDATQGVQLATMQKLVT